MADRHSILIVEDDDILAMNLVAAAEDRGCAVVGPVASVAAALSALSETGESEGGIDAAVLDANLLDRDVTPVAMALIEKAIPFVIHTGFGLPAELESVFPHVSVIMKPADPDTVIAQLLTQIAALRNAGSGATSPDLSDGARVRDRQISKVAAALFDQFGAKAVVLARRQASDSRGSALSTWSAIIEDLTNRQSAQG